MLRTRSRSSYDGQAPADSGLTVASASPSRCSRSLAGAAGGCVASLVEDGLHVDAAFRGFVASAALPSPGLRALAAVVARERRGRRRLLALIPLVTPAAITRDDVGGEGVRFRGA